MNGFDQSDHIIDGRLRQDSMAQVKDMTGPAAGAAQDLFDSPANFSGRGKEHGWIEIPLDRDIASQAFPGFVEIYSPVHADDIASGSTEGFEKPASAGAEVDGWDARSQACESCARIAKNESLVVFGR